ncbi:LAME_0A03400g1_1 [Lachancea meyersii CBS 8951]|uniref:NAD-dependent protein deacetylase n=1 Tax=Lachancea meyersii CBS 8951 TaxID=1266667 RepID=A0A1G4IN77_9SACH|nr:LAME_0A03400g1_1 [Lachancea meyersii CBS 8951]
MSADQFKKIEKIANFINSNPKAKVVFLVGAGISTACGIPDFRSPETGLYDNLAKLKLPFAEAVFDIDYFRENPQPFYTLAKELYPGNYEPSKFHHLMRVFQDKGRLHRIYTQNIDTLERSAGIRSNLVVEAHGSFAHNHCIDCGMEYPHEFFKQAMSNTAGAFARCKSCEGLIKPKIVFFGENLPSHFFSTWDEDLEQLNENHIVIVAGTSLAVYPFASLPSEIPKSVRRALVNLQKVGDFLASPRKSDIIFNGSSEVAAEELARKLGWLDELESLVEAASSRRQQSMKEAVSTVSKGAEEVLNNVVQEMEHMSLSNTSVNKSETVEVEQTKSKPGNEEQGKQELKKQEPEKQEPEKTEEMKRGNEQRRKEGNGQENDKEQILEKMENKN